MYEDGCVCVISYIYFGYNYFVTLLQCCEHVKIYMFVLLPRKQLKQYFIDLFAIVENYQQHFFNSKSSSERERERNNEHTINKSQKMLKLEWYPVFLIFFNEKTRLTSFRIEFINMLKYNKFFDLKSFITISGFLKLVSE